MNIQWYNADNDTTKNLRGHLVLCCVILHDTTDVGHIIDILLMVGYFGVSWSDTNHGSLPKGMFQLLITANCCPSP